MLRPLRLTQDEVLAIQEELIQEYKKVVFQLRLREAWRKVGGYRSEQQRAVRNVCRYVQEPVMERYGFDLSESGLHDFQNALNAVGYTEEMERNRSSIAWLLSLEHQEDWPGHVQDAEIPSLGQRNLRSEDIRAKGSRWVVIGGQQGRGILVRKGRDLDSPALAYRLSVGAQVRAEEEVDSNRLHFRRLTGDGPDFGWISIEVNGNALVKPDLEGTSVDKAYGVGVHLCNPVHQRFKDGSWRSPDIAAHSLREITFNPNSGVLDFAR